jgi:hypothetical protein
MAIGVLRLGLGGSWPRTRFGEEKKVIFLYSLHPRFMGTFDNLWIPSQVIFYWRWFVSPAHAKIGFTPKPFMAIRLGRGNWGRGGITP